MADSPKKRPKLLVWFILALGVIFLLVALLFLYRGLSFWSGFMMSLSGSTVVSALMTWLGDWYDVDNREAIVKRIDGMKEILGDRSFVLYNTQRSELKGSYDELYNGADTIKICGVLLEAVINYICLPKKKPDNWVRRLAGRPNVDVTLIIPDPDSEYVALLDKMSGNGTMPLLANKIRGRIGQLKNLEKQYKAAGGSLKNFPPLADGSSIKVYTTPKTINFSITHAGNSRDPLSNTLLFGLLLNRDAGPIYEVHDDLGTKLHGTILHYFGMLIEGVEPFFVWDENGIRCS